MKIHCGAGDVYLTPGWLNIDLEIPGYSFLASDRPDLVEQNRTTLDHYYRRPYGTPGPYQETTEHHEVLCVVDAFMDATELPLEDNCVETLLSVQLLEHFTPADAVKVLNEWHRVLQPGGQLIVDVPDLFGIAQRFMYCETSEENDYWIRMIYCSHKNSHAIHKSGYDEHKLTSLLLDVGFRKITDLRNPFNHPYPSLTFSGTK